MLTDTLKQTIRLKKMLDFTKHKKVMTVVRWFKRPLVQRILLLIASTLLAMSFGVSFLSSSHMSFSGSASFETRAMVLAQDKPVFCNGTNHVQGGCSADTQTVTIQVDVSPLCVAGATIVCSSHYM